MTSECREMRAWLNGSLRAPLEDHNKITNGSLSRCVSHKWRRSCDSMKICKSYPKLNMPQYGIERMIGQKNQMMSNHLSANVQSRSSTFVIESDLSVQKALLKERLHVWAWLSGSREAPLGDRDKITKMSSPRRVSCNWGWSCKSMKIRKSHPKRKYTLVWHRMCGRSEKSGNTKSLIIKYAIPVIQTHYWNEPKHQWSIPQKKKHDDIQISTKS